jgi:hypothetical protein
MAAFTDVAFDAKFNYRFRESARRILGRKATPEDQSATSTYYSVRAAAAKGLIHLHNPASRISLIGEGPLAQRCTD